MNPALVAVFLLAGNHALFGASAFAWWLWALWFALAAAAAYRGPIAFATVAAPRPTWISLAIGLAILAPPTAKLALTIDREFGFGGDASFHIGVAFRLFAWWLSVPGTQPPRILDASALDALRAAPYLLAFSRAALFAAALALYVALRRRRGADIVLIAALLAWGAFESAQEFRYPGLAYLAAAVFAPLGYLAGAPELAFRFGNLAAVSVWLFALRPWLVGRWPDAGAALLAVFVFWTESALLFLDAAYLEPWALVFLLLAVELRAREGVPGAALACLLIGAAAACKEAAIFALPFVWLSAQPWRRGSGDATLAAFAAGLPFLSFVAVNRAIGQVRPIAFEWPDANTLAALGETLSRLGQGGGGFAVVGLGLAALGFALARERIAAFSFAAAAVFQIAFFVLERGSAGYAGTPRFFLPALALMAFGLAAFAAERRGAWALAAALATVQAPGVAVDFARALGPPGARSFAEYYDAPFVFPIKSATSEMGALGGPVLVLRPDDAVEAGATMGAQGAALVFADGGTCKCSAERPAVMALAPRASGYAAADLSGSAPVERFFGPLPERIVRWRAARAAMPMCLAEMRATCARVVVRTEADQILLVFGAANSTSSTTR